MHIRKKLIEVTLPLEAINTASAREKSIRHGHPETITVTRNEILYSLNKPEDFILAVVEFDRNTHRVHYVRQPFQREPDFGVTGVNYSFAELIARASEPA